MSQETSAAPPAPKPKSCLGCKHSRQHYTHLTGMVRCFATQPVDRRVNSVGLIRMGEWCVPINTGAWCPHFVEKPQPEAPAAA